MTNREYAARCKYLSAENRKYGNFLRRVDASEVSEWNAGSPPLCVFRSREFLLLVYEAGEDVRLTVCRTAIDRQGNWKADIDWETLQELKRQAGYGDCCAVEVYPPDSDIVNVANMRHLWILEHPPEFMWRKRR